MKPTYLTFFLALLYSGSLLAQDSSSAYSLKECVEYAFKNQVNIENSRLDEAIADSKIKEIRAVGLPQVSATGSLVDNPALKRMFLEAGPNTANFIPPGVAKDGEVLAIPNLFQLRSSGDMGATINQLIFDGSFIIGLKAAKTYAELTTQNAKKSKVETVESVSKAYYLVLINKERLTLLDANVNRMDSMLAQTKALYKEGYVEKIDVDRLEVNYNNLKSEKDKVVNHYQLSQILLKYQMGMPVEENLELSGAIQDIQLEDNKELSQVDASNRIEYQIFKTDLELKTLDLKGKQATYLPRLSAFASGGYFTQHTSFTNLFSSSWYPYAMYGLNLNVPIFDGFDKANKVKQARLEIEKSQNNLRNMENTIKYQAEQSKFSLENNLKTLETLRSNMNLAQEVARIARVKFEAGVGSNLELVNAETDYKEAQTNFFNALYDVVVANIDYKKSLGTLYSE